MTAPPKVAPPKVAPPKSPSAPTTSPGRAKDAPRTIRELRIARESKRKAAPKPVVNPLREGLRLERVPDPAILVLFGATGDLAHRKVVPALYQLWRTNLLPHEFMLVASGRRAYGDDAFRAEPRQALDQLSPLKPEVA